MAAESVGYNLSVDTRLSYDTQALMSQTADRWESAFTAINIEGASPAGSSWEGVAADQAFHRTYQDRIRVVAAADSLRAAASIATTGATQVASARSRLASTVEQAPQAGFDVADDFSVRDVRTVNTAAARAARHAQRVAIAGDIRARAAELTFPQAPPTEPPPTMPEV